MTLYNVEGMPQDVVTFLVWQICKGCVNIMWFNHAKNTGFFAFRVINLFIFDIVWLYYKHHVKHAPDGTVLPSVNQQ